MLCAIRWHRTPAEHPLHHHKAYTCLIVGGGLLTQHTLGALSSRSLTLNRFYTRLPRMVARVSNRMMHTFPVRASDSAYIVPSARVSPALLFYLLKPLLNTTHVWTGNADLFYLFFNRRRATSGSFLILCSGRIAPRRKCVNKLKANQSLVSSHSDPRLSKHHHKQPIIERH